jgi:hypothetical protein
MQKVREHLLVIEVEFDVDLVKFCENRKIWEQYRIWMF